MQQSRPRYVDFREPVLSRANNYAAVREMLAQSENSTTREIEILGKNYVRLSLQPPIGKGYVDFIEFASDFMVVISDSLHSQPIKFNYMGEDWAKFTFRLSGEYQAGLSKNWVERLSSRTSHILLHPRGHTQTDHFLPGKASRWVSILCKHSRLIDKFGLEPDLMPRRFSSFLEGNNDEMFLDSSPLSPGCERFVRQLLKVPDNLGLRPLYVKSNVYSLLYQYMEESFGISETSSCQGNLSRRDIDRLEESREILSSDMLNSFNMHTLSRKVGLNRNKLSYGFRDYFGITIFEFCRQTRMKKAYEMLQNTEMSILQIADAVGYTHASSLSAAFKTFYRRTPIQVRNESRAARSRSIGGNTEETCQKNILKLVDC